MAQNYGGPLWNSIREAHRSLVKRESSVVKFCNESIKQIELTKRLNPFITFCGKEALDKANQLDKLLLDNKYQPNNPLFGIPISIKDNFCTEQLLTTCGSKMLHNYIPPYNATVVSKLMDENCLMMGKTNMDEFAMGSSCTTSFYGSTANYLKHELLENEIPKLDNSSRWYMAGGSSTGSAVSVASGSCFASLGTDTGGSTRQPASLTGVVGFKPTYGLISRFGLIPLVHCLDVVSILARKVDDVKLVFDTIIGQDENDLTTVNHLTELKSSLEPINKSSEGAPKITIRVGIPDKFISDGDISEDISNQYDQTLTSLSSNKFINGSVKFEIIKLSLPNAALATECYTIISSAEIASNMSCYDGVKFGFSTEHDRGKDFNREEFFMANRDAGFGSEVKKRILLGNYFMLSENREKYLMKALKLRRLINDEFARAFNENNIDVIFMPSTPSTSVPYDKWLEKQDNNKLFHEDYFLIPSNLANLPSISLPVGFSKSGLPIGLQLVAKKFYDLDLLTISSLFESMVEPK